MNDMSPEAGTTADQLRSIIERIENMEEEKANITADIREIYSEAKGNGFDVKALREIIKLRKKNDHERQEEEAVLATYMHAIGMADPAE